MGIENRGRYPRDKLESFIDKCKAVHGDIFDYSKVNYINNHTKVEVACNICHYTFYPTPANIKNGSGCPKCSGKMPWTKELFIEKSESIYGDHFDYSKVGVTRRHSKVTLICKLTGRIVEQLLSSHVEGASCPACNPIKKTTDDFIQDSKRVHGDNFLYHLVNYTNNKTKVLLVCSKGHTFKTRPDGHLSRREGCPYCAGSNQEDGFRDFISTLGIEFTPNDRSLIGPLELDIVLPGMKLAIEYNGVYWHSEACGKTDKYHLQKTIMCRDKGYSLIHVYEDEWVSKTEIVKSKIRGLVNSTRCGVLDVYEIHSVDNTTSSAFFNSNHILGSYKDTTTSLGLFIRGILVACVSLGCTGSSEVKLLRYSTLLNTNVYGGLDKLLRYYRNTDNRVIIAYLDARWPLDEVSTTLGFRYIENTLPDYKYVKGANRVSKSVYTYRGMCSSDLNTSEERDITVKGLPRIWDCGMEVWEYA